MSAFVLGGASLPAWLHLAAIAHQEGPFRRFARLLLGLPSHRRGASGRMALYEGRVSARGRVVRRRVEFVSRQRTERSTTPDGWAQETRYTALEARERTEGGKFEVETDAGPMEVDARDGVVAFARRRWVAHPSRAVYEETLGEGDVVCVGGRAVADGDVRSVAAAGEESLLLYGGSRRDLVLALWAARLRLLAGLGIAVAPIALATHLLPSAALFRVAGSVTDSSHPRASVGDRCDVRWAAFDTGFGQRCRLRVWCGDERLVGDFWTGTVPCSFEPTPTMPSLEVREAEADASGALVRASLARREVVWRDPDRGIVRIALTTRARAALCW
jgi:hypothetical protein